MKRWVGVLLDTPPTSPIDVCYGDVSHRPRQRPRPDHATDHASDHVSEEGSQVLRRLLTEEPEEPKKVTNDDKMTEGPEDKMTDKPEETTIKMKMTEKPEEPEDKMTEKPEKPEEPEETIGNEVQGHVSFKLNDEGDDGDEDERLLALLLE